MSYQQPPENSWQPYGTYVEPGRRPGTVTAAGWITVVVSSTTALLLAGMFLVLILAQDSVIEAMQSDATFQDAVGGDSQLANDAAGALTAITGGLALWSLIATVLGFLVLRRSNVARILLVISSVLSALATLPLIVAVLPAAWTLASLAVTVLLFVGGASEWFARREPPPAYGEA